MRRVRGAGLTLEAPLLQPPAPSLLQPPSTLIQGFKPPAVFRRGGLPAVRHQHHTFGGADGPCSSTHIIGSARISIKRQKKSATKMDFLGELDQDQENTSFTSYHERGKVCPIMTLRHIMKRFVRNDVSFGLFNVQPSKQGEQNFLCLFTQPYYVQGWVVFLVQIIILIITITIILNRCVPTISE